MTEPDLLTFVAASIRSVWALELLLFLKRNSARAWDRNSLILKLRSSSAVITEALTSLEAGGLGDAKRRDRVSVLRHLADAGSDRVGAGAPLCVKPLSVINAIVSSPTVRLRMFSDAFKLKE